MYFDPFSLMFSIFPLIVIVLFVVVLVRGLREWSRNNASPRLSVPATVMTKRRAHHHNGQDNGAHSVGKAPLLGHRGIGPTAHDDEADVAEECGKVVVEGSDVLAAIMLVDVATAL